jgi:Domain of unknown function (DUF4190)/zinc-ribbon domain
MFCTRCGANNLENDQFCRSCSAPLVRPGSAQSQSASSESPPYPYSPSDPAQQQPPYPYSPSDPAQQQPQGYTPYPGYQGYPPSQYSYANQMSAQQGGASGRAIAAMVVGIVSLVMCCWPASIVSIVLGKMEMNAIKEGRAPQAGETMAKVGFYMGIVVTAVSLLATALYFIGIFASIAGNSYQ